MSQVCGRRGTPEQGKGAAVRSSAPGTGRIVVNLESTGSIRRGDDSGVLLPDQTRAEDYATGNLDGPCKYRLDLHLR